MITAEYLGVTGEGKTLKAAKADAARKVRDFVEAAKSPLVHTYRGYTMIAWQTGVDGGAYTYTSPDDAAQDADRIYCCMSSGDRYEAMRAVRRHVASLLEDANCADHSDRQSVQRQLDEARVFNALYKAHRAAGKSDTEAHRLACDRVAA